MAGDIEKTIDCYRQKVIDYQHYNDYMQYQNQELPGWIEGINFDANYLIESEDYFDLENKEKRWAFDNFMPRQCIDFFLRINAESGKIKEYSSRKTFNIYSDASDEERWISW